MQYVEKALQQSVLPQYTGSQEIESDNYRIDPGDRYIKKCWGFACTTEVAYACLEYGFQKLRLQTITGRVVLKNTASIHVPRKCGM